jgi:hypothetical protein
MERERELYVNIYIESVACTSNEFTQPQAVVAVEVLTDEMQ